MDDDRRGSADSPGRRGLRSPLAAALALYAAFMALHLAVAWDGGRLVTTLVPDVGPWLGPVGWAIYAAFAVAVVAATGGWRRTGLTRRPAHRWWRLLAVPLAAGLPFALFGWNLESSSIVPLIVVGTPLVALNEELFFRGILLDMLAPLGTRRAITWTAVLFGASHVVNVVSGAYPPFVAMQVAATTGGGIALAAIRLRTGSLAPVLVLHVLVDVVAVGALTGPATNSPLLLPVLFAWLAANLALAPYGWRLLTGAGGGAAATAPVGARAAPPPA